MPTLPALSTLIRSVPLVVILAKLAPVATRLRVPLVAVSVTAPVPVMLPTAVRLPETSAPPLKFCPQSVLVVVRVAALPSILVIPVSARLALARLMATAVVPMFIVWLLTARVPVVGNVTLVAAVVVRVSAKLPEVVRLFARLRFPASVIDLLASLTLMLNVLRAVRSAELVTSR